MLAEFDLARDLHLILITTDLVPAQVVLGQIREGCVTLREAAEGPGGEDAIRIPGAVQMAVRRWRRNAVWHCRFSNLVLRETIVFPSPASDRPLITLCYDDYGEMVIVGQHDIQPS